MAKRPTFEQACARYVNRFTMEHVPAMARLRPCDHGGTETRYYAPQFRTDRDWYDNTTFPGEPDHIGIGSDCYTTGQTWPLGQWLIEPYRKGAANAPAAPTPDLRGAAATLSWLAVQFRDRANDDGEPTSIQDAEQVEAALKAVQEAIAKVEE